MNKSNPIFISSKTDIEDLYEPTFKDPDEVEQKMATIGERIASVIVAKPFDLNANDFSGYMGFVLTFDKIYLVRVDRIVAIPWSRIKNWFYAASNYRPGLTIKLRYLEYRVDHDAVVITGFPSSSAFNSKHYQKGSLDLIEFLKIVYQLSSTHVESELELLEKDSQRKNTSSKQYQEQERLIRCKLFPYEIIDQLSKTADEIS